MKGHNLDSPNLFYMHWNQRFDYSANKIDLYGLKCSPLNLRQGPLFAPR